MPLFRMEVVQSVEVRKPVLVRAKDSHEAYRKAERGTYTAFDGVTYQVAVDEPWVDDETIKEVEETSEDAN